MDIYEELDVIVRFEDRFGNRESVKRVCDLMVSYLSGMQKPLPEITVQGFRVAKKFKEGSVGYDDLERERSLIRDFLRERSAVTDLTTPEYAMPHVVSAILYHYQDPTWGGGAAELALYFLHSTELVESNYDLLKRLLGEYFSLPANDTLA